MVSQALINETERMVVIRWGYDEDPLCQEADRIMEAIENECINMAVFCTVDLKEVPDFIVEHKLYDPYTIMFFYKRKVIVFSCYSHVSLLRNNKGRVFSYRCNVHRCSQGTSSPEHRRKSTSMLYFH
eukprot:jgi/Bigna1/56735/estExt_Genewise1Plus.C_1170033